MGYILHQRRTDPLPLVKEYGFWQTKRLDPNGLNFYSSNVTDEGLLTEYGDTFAKRFGVQPSDDREPTLERGRSILALFECGWDCSSRFGYEAHHINPVCLASLLYTMETNGAYFADVLGKAEEAEMWRSRTVARCFAETGNLWEKHNMVTGKVSSTTEAQSHTPTMMGWSAGVFLYCINLLKENGKV